MIGARKRGAFSPQPNAGQVLCSTLIRVLKASSFYPAYTKQFFSGNRQLSALSYKDQWQLLEDDMFAGIGVWRSALEPLGDFEVWEVVLNAEILQKTWAREHGVGYQEETWLQEIFLAQLRSFQPNLLFALAFDFLTPEVLSRFKREMPGLRVISYEGIAIGQPFRFAATDLMLSCAPFMLDVYRAAGMRTAVLGHGFDDRVLGLIGRADPQHAVSFVGGLSLGPKGHHARLEWLDAVARRVPVSLFLQIDHPVRLTLRYAKLIVLQPERRGRLREAMHQIPKVYRLHSASGGPRYGWRMFQVLAASRLTLNSHIDAAGNHAANMRLFEATGVGACLLTDWKPNLKEYFEIDKEVVAYRTVDECVEKIRFLVNQPAVTQAIGEAGQRRTLRDYNARDQIKAIAPALRNLLN